MTVDWAGREGGQLLTDLNVNFTSFEPKSLFYCFRNMKLKSFIRERMNVINTLSNYRLIIEYNKNNLCISENLNVMHKQILVRRQLERSEAGKTSGKDQWTK